MTIGAPIPERHPLKANADQGLFRKFNVTRTDGTDAPGGKHHGCEYFVLDLTHDQHAVAAVLAYADACAPTHPFLAADLRARYSLEPKPVAGRTEVSGVTFDSEGRGRPLVVRAHGPDGVVRDVGRIQRLRSRRWGLFLDGIYWTGNQRIGMEPNTRGGITGVDCRTRNAARQLAITTLRALGMRA